MAELNELHDDLREVIEDMAESAGIDPSFAKDQLERSFGLDFGQVSEEDQIAFAEAYQTGDDETQRELLLEYGVDEETIEQLEQQADEMTGDDTDADGEDDDPLADTSDALENGESSDAPAREGGLTEAEIDKKIEEAVPSARDIVNMLKDEMGASAGGQGGGGGGGEGGGMNPQQQMALEFVKDFMLKEAGGGGAAELGEKVQEEAMKNVLRQFSKPSLGEIIEYKIYENISEDIADDMAKDIVPEGMDSLHAPDDSDSDDESHLWND